MKAWQELLTEQKCDLDTIWMTTGGNVLHGVAMPEIAELILSHGYQGLLLQPATDSGKDWPLLYAVWAATDVGPQPHYWRTVKIYMEVLDPK